MQFCLSEISCIFFVLWLNSCHHGYGLNIRPASCSEEVLWILGAYFNLSFRHILYVCKMVTLFSVCQGNSNGVCTTLVLVTGLLMFPYFLVLPWICLLLFFSTWISPFTWISKNLYMLFPLFTFSGWEPQGIPTQKCTTWVVFLK